jgi:phosphatidylglycerophosphatase A
MMMINTLIKFLATGFYTGLFPLFPGTVGSLAAVFLAWFFSWELWQIFIFSLLGIFICAQAETLFAEHDSGKIVYDEFCGMFLAVWGASTPGQYFVAFLLFRLFDIVKPFPINKSQELPGGWGVMADDLLAGGVARLILAILITCGIL